MTDEEILEAAERIRRRRLNEARLKSFEEKETVMIRWNNGLRHELLESYTSLNVPRGAVAELVRDHFNTLIAKDASTKPSASR